MSEHVEDHTLEILRRLQSETTQGFDTVRKAIEDLTAESRIANAHLVGLVRFESYATNKMADLDSRIARIEKRLELNDPAIAE